MSNTSMELACANIGNISTLQCCTTSHPNSAACQSSFADRTGILDRGCRLDFLGEDCIAGCQNKRKLYTSFLQNGRLDGSGQGPVERFAACVNVPAVAKAARTSGVSTASDGDSQDEDVQDLTLPAGFSREVEQHIGVFTDGDLMKVTSAVTDCLSSTCRFSRRRDLCYDNYCSPVALLVDNTTPNVTAISRCVEQICGMGYNALPYADPDITGVWLSYVLQCAFVVGLLLASLASVLFTRRKKRGGVRDNTRQSTLPERQSLRGPSNETGETKEVTSSSAPATWESKRPESLWRMLLLEFHKTQCYFAATLMVASFHLDLYGRTDMLQIFLLIPISLNGILPVIFAYFLLVSHTSNPGHDKLGPAILTAVVYILSSVVYWSLYNRFWPYSANNYAPGIWAAVGSRLSGVDACGGHSALALCPDLEAFQRGIGDVERAGDKLLVLTPMIWAFSTLVFGVLLVVQFCRPHPTLLRRKGNGHPAYVGIFTLPWIKHDARASLDGEEGSRSVVPSTTSKIVFVTVLLAFLAGMGMQMSLLSIAWSLHMMDEKAWTFGQIVAITIWIPPIVEILYEFGRRKKEKYDSYRNEQ